MQFIKEHSDLAVPKSLHTPTTRLIRRQSVQHSRGVFEAWANNVKFKWDMETIRRMMQRRPVPAEPMISIIDQFPFRSKAMASRPSANDNGPFPLRYDDFLHRNTL
ncbi:hypothetical protein CONLIGDRAFT_639967 [Coniochaeta ligniaria NRRL 30616]|uniref:Uncharacterized protein n=1 Tax=Coniochaeta ligniaria NRRL 30616 TaxID=1408157 RepID=A0A1J7JZW8_9PEZI|nr:hypothetical protein CONLIGDRAFT_639967 [Coniochaeta ligniaria NRRL 30616]